MKPCQPFSTAGRRKGTTDERHLWPYFAEAIRVLRPRYVVLENVAGHRSMGFDRVLADLAGLRYDAQWCSLRASDVGAPHRRERLFVLAYAECIGCDSRFGESAFAAESPGRFVNGASARTTPNTARDGRHEGRPESARLLGEPDASLSGAGPVALLPTPRSRDGKGATASRLGDNKHDLPSALLPTPTGRDGKGANQRGDDSCLTGTLLATLSAADAHLNRSGSRKDEFLLPGQAHEMATAWGKYEPAIRRWETRTRPAPVPTESNTKGNPRLSAGFSEWLMGWPEGWVTDVLGISRNDALRIIGNGVVPQQAIAAISWLLWVSEEAA